MTGTHPTFRKALALLSARLVQKQIGLALLVFLLSMIWLRVPDASAFDVIVSILLGLIVIAVAGAGESWIVLQLCGADRTRGKLLRGTLCIAVGVALWFGWNAFIAHFQAADELRAGYLNSRFNHSLRYFFTYPHLLLWFGWMWTALTSIGTGIIAAFAIAAIAAAKPLNAIKHALRSITYWIALIVGPVVATTITNHLIEWTPGHGLHVEMLSLVLRLVAAVIVDAVVACFLLTILAVCVREASGNSAA